VKKCIFCAILLLTLPAFATIANVQSNASWTCTGTGTSIMCPVTLTTYPTVNHHMLAVWTFWESTSTYTASVSDSQNNGIYNGTIYVYPSAVGPTLQSASNASAQILYGGWPRQSRSLNSRGCPVQAPLGRGFAQPKKYVFVTHPFPCAAFVPIREPLRRPSTFFLNPVHHS
jgi:hypothetical protein